MTRFPRADLRRGVETRIGDWERGRGPIRAAVVYPNVYAVGMASLGFLSVFCRIAEDPRFTADRAFLPHGQHRRLSGGIVTHEERWPFAAVDLLAFSVSFENDFLNLVAILHAAGVPLLSRERTDRDPLVLAGGVALAINPEPVADLLDVVLLGEAEGALPAFLDRFAAWKRFRRGREAFLDSLADLPHAYVPSRYRVRYHGDGTIAERTPARGFPEKIRLARAPDGALPCVSPIVTRQAAFEEMVLVEAGRGCGRLCRFCAAGFLYLPPRPQARDAIARAAAAAPPGLPVGLLGTAVSDHGDLSALLADAGAGGRRVSLSSIRTGNLSPADYRRLAEGSARQVALAPEAGTERLRRVLNKDLAGADLLRECDVLREAGISRVKLYFMTGLPTETDEDLAAIPILARAARERLAGGKGRAQVELSVNPMIPKPHTPFQWLPLADAARLRRAETMIRAGLRGGHGLSATFESVRMAERQALLSRGDRRLGEALVRAMREGRPLAQILNAAGLSPAFDLRRERAEGEVFPWDFIDTGVSRAFLRAEWRRAFSGKLSPRCEVGACRRCGVCGETGSPARGN